MDAELLEKILQVGNRSQGPILEADHNDDFTDYTITSKRDTRSLETKFYALSF